MVDIDGMEFTVHYGTVKGVHIAAVPYCLSDQVAYTVTFGLSLEHAIYCAAQFLAILDNRTNDLAPYLTQPAPKLVD